MVAYDMIMIMSSDFLTLLSDLPCQRRKVAAGVLLFQRNDPVRFVYAIEKGAACLLRRQSDGAAFVLQRAGPGAILAEASIGTARYHCAAETVTDAGFRIWERSAIAALLSGSHEAAAAYAAHLAGEVRQARLRAEILSLRRVADRLDAWLAWHDDCLPAKGLWRQVAQDINVTPEALYREIAKRKGTLCSP